MSLERRLQKLVELRIDARALAATRILVGLAALVKAWVVWRIFRSVLEPEHLALPYFDWLPRVSESGLALYIAAWAAMALLLTVGWRTRLSGLGLVALEVYALALDQQLYSNHLYLLAILCFLLVVGDSGARWSIDAWRRKPRPATIPAWPALLMMWQLTIVYAFAALTKINRVYLSGAVLNAHFGRDSWIAWPEAWRVWWVFSPMAVAAIVGELFLAAALWSPRWRRPAALFGVGFHAMLIVVMPRLVTGDLIVFALEMFSVYVLFFLRPALAGNELAPACNPATRRALSAQF